MGFAVIDANHDGYVDEAEFLKSCGLTAAGPSPAPAPAPNKPPEPGKHQDVKLDTCLSVKIMDKSSWPKDAFKGTGFKDSPLLDQVVGSSQLVAKEEEKGVMVPAPDGKSEWFFPKGTYYCVQATSGQSPAPPPVEMVSSRAPAPAIANIVPIIVGGSPSAASLLQEDLPPAAIENNMDLAPGAHCIEAMVMVPPGARDLKLMYSGPDTHMQETVIPGQMVHCDPVIPACSDPGRHVCSTFQKQCGPGPAPAPGAGSPAPAAV